MRALNPQPSTRTPARRRTHPRAACGVIGLLLVFSPWAASTSQAADPNNAVAHGRKLYQAVGCWQCHGTVGQGGAAGPRLAPGPLPLDALRAFIRHSVRTMPAYPESILSDQAVADIHAYLQSLPAAARAGTLPLLRDLK